MLRSVSDAIAGFAVTLKMEQMFVTGFAVLPQDCRILQLRGFQTIVRRRKSS